MKDKIHPKYVECVVTCGCGETFATRSTKEKINVEICSRCHPFYTGKQKLVDTAGRVEKFQKRYGWGLKKEQPPKAAEEPQKPEPEEETESKTAAEPSEPSDSAQ